MDENAPVFLDQIASDGLKERTFATAYSANDTDKFPLGYLHIQIGETKSLFSRLPRKLGLLHNQRSCNIRIGARWMRTIIRAGIHIA